MPNARRVRRLYLRGPDEATIRRGALLVEDALRTASLPVPAGRVVVVRRLALGSIARGMTSARLSRLVERALERSDLVWYHGLDARAARGDVVWFTDPVEAHVALARRVRSGRAADEWFWPLAVPTWRGGADGGDATQRLRDSLGTLPEAAAALAAFDAQLAEDEVAAAPPLPASGQGVPRERVKRGGRAEAVGELEPAPARSPADPANPPTEAPRSGTPPDNLAAVSSPGRGGARRHPSRAVRSPSPLPLEAGATDKPEPSRRAPRASDTSVRGVAALSRAPAGSAAPAAGGVAAAEEGDARRHLDSAALLRGEAELTAAGGLPFLINVLHEIGYPEWLADQPEWAGRRVGQRMLRTVLDRLAVAAEDPVRRMLESSVVEKPGPQGFAAPSRWSPDLWRGRAGRIHRRNGGLERTLEPAGQLLLAATVTDRDDARSELDREVVDAWSTAARRWMRRTARIGFASLVRRPALLTITSTHVDLFFDLERSDLRVRRAGLDLDPGWVAWLGRVVSFHYLPRSGR